MGRSQESFNKKEVRKKKAKKRIDKEKKKQERKENSGKPDFDDMIAYVDEYGNFVDTPPDPEEKEEIKVEDIELSHKKDTEENNGRKTGIVNFFNDEKGFGFIRDLDTNQSIFVHISEAEEELAEGNKVSFQAGSGEKGPIALDVKIEK